MDMTALTESQKEEISRIFRALFRAHSKDSVYDVAKVFFSVQPGDSIAYSPENAKDVAASMERLSELDSDFRIKHTREPSFEKGPYLPGRIIYFNAPLLEETKEARGIDDLLEIFIKMEDEIKPDTETLTLGIPEEEIPKYHRHAGAFFGFPECCIEAYLKGEYEQGMPPGKYLEHRACSPDCEESARMLERYRPIRDFIDRLTEGDLR